MFGLECREKTANDGGRAGGLQSTALLGDGRMLTAQVQSIANNDYCCHEKWLWAVAAAGCCCCCCCCRLHRLTRRRLTRTMGLGWMPMQRVLVRLSVCLCIFLPSWSFCFLPLSLSCLLCVSLSLHLSLYSSLFLSACLLSMSLCSLIDVFPRLLSVSPPGSLYFCRYLCLYLYVS